MKLVTMTKFARLEHNLFAYAALIYAVIGGFGTVFQIPGLQRLTKDPTVIVSAAAFFLYALTRQAMRLQDEVTKLASVKQLIFHEDIDNTYGSMWTRLVSAKPKRVWATYLNPEAFSTGSPPESLAAYYAQAEKLEVPDYRRVFGIYPNRPEVQEKREKSIEWLRGHRERTRRLKGYQARYVELDFQAAELLVDDRGLNFSFPSERATEAGWATTDREIQDAMKDYFHQVWARSRSIDDLFTEPRRA